MSVINRCDPVPHLSLDAALRMVLAAENLAEAGLSWQQTLSLVIWHRYTSHNIYYVLCSRYRKDVCFSGIQDTYNIICVYIYIYSTTCLSLYIYTLSLYKYIYIYIYRERERDRERERESSFESMETEYRRSMYLTMLLRSSCKCQLALFLHTSGYVDYLVRHSPIDLTFIGHLQAISP